MLVDVNGFEAPGNSAASVLDQVRAIASSLPSSPLTVFAVLIALF